MRMLVGVEQDSVCCHVDCRIALFGVAFVSQRHKCPELAGALDACDRLLATHWLIVTYLRL